MRVIFFVSFVCFIFPRIVFAVDSKVACVADGKIELKVSLLYDIRDSLKEELSNCVGINRTYKKQLGVIAEMLTVERGRARILREDAEAYESGLEESLAQNIEHESELGSLRRRLAGQLKFIRAVSVAGGAAILLLIL